MAEPPPANFVPREAELTALVEQLTGPQPEQTVALTTALKGAGGYGKTTLAQAICHDEQVRAAFPDGILWVTLGETVTNLAGQVEDLSYHLSGTRPGFSGLEAWPLLLTLTHGTLRERVQDFGLSLTEALAEIKEELAEFGLVAFDAAEASQRNQAVTATIQVSLKRLTEAEQTRFRELAIFPEDTPIPVATLERWWGSQGQLTRPLVRRLYRRLAGLSLLREADKATIQLHDVIRHYLIEQQAAELPTLHADFLNTYRPLLENPDRPDPQWHTLPGDEPYLWGQLGYHLIEAGLSDELYETVTDLNYLASKSHYRGATGAEADLNLSHSHFPTDPTLTTLRRHFTNAAHLLERGETLADVHLTLYSRLHSIEGLSDLSQALLVPVQGLMLIPSQPLPDLPAPGLLRTLRGHTHVVNSCAYSPDGAYICSASADGTLKVWEAATGRGVHTLTGHTERVNSCAYSPDGVYLCSASWDKTLKVWEVSTGRCVLTLAVEGVLRDCAWSSDGWGLVAVGAGGGLFF